MPRGSSRGLRGSGLEELINITNDRYREAGLALIQKIPTPITPVRIDKETKHITLAYFDQKSTIDYIGAVQGIPVCFDAKESAADTFALANIHEHQIRFMKDFEKQGGVAFFLISYTHRETLYYMRFSEAERFWKRMCEGGRKSIRFEELSEEWFFKAQNGTVIPYLLMIQKDLDERDC
jgi:recombination protein U